ncbi:hypothetical protein [Amycolatopsis sp. lyj-109]|uniref:hypothetical protein n=1 Tax=Amycolatopsis sp. lyj-109 TaxID=2789287 RepID=UPI00397DCFB3
MGSSGRPALTGRACSGIAGTESGSSDCPASAATDDDGSNSADPDSAEAEAEGHREIGSCGCRESTAAAEGRCRGSAPGVKHWRDRPRWGAAGAGAGCGRSDMGSSGCPGSVGDTTLTDMATLLLRG